MQTLNLERVGGYVSGHRLRVLAVTAIAVLTGPILFASGVALASEERESAEAPAVEAEQYRTMDRADTLGEQSRNVAASPGGEVRAVDTANTIEALRNEAEMSNPGQAAGTLRTQDVADTVESLQNATASSNPDPNQSPVRLPRH